MKAELLSFWGGDEMVCDAARVSFDKLADEYSIEQNGKLITYLAKHGHTSPFRHPHFQFRVQCPIYVERQLFKHQIGWTANSISGRYVDFSDEYYHIQDWRKQSTSSKQGSEGLIEDQQAAFEIEYKVIDYCQKAYDELLALGVSKEQARTILPLNLQSKFVWTGSLQAFIHLCHLRIKNDAQQETSRLVSAMLAEVKEKTGNAFQYSFTAFGL